MKEIIPSHFSSTAYITETQMLNHIGLHENNLHNTDGGQATGKELRHVEMSRCIMHRGETEKSNQQHARVVRWQAMQ